MSTLAGLRAVVTGGASGIGLASVRMLRERGARAVAIDRVAPRAGDGDLLPADLRDDAAVDAAMTGAAARMGGIDILINSAGIDLEAESEQVTDADWARVIDVNLSGPMRACRAAFPWLKASGQAAVVNVSSAAGLRPIPDRAAYCASKAGVVMLSRSLALDWAEHGIRVNTVCPGAVETPLFARSYEDFPDPAVRLAEIRSRYPLNRIGTVEELAEAILFLATPSGSYITGVALPVDGGRSFH